MRSGIALLVYVGACAAWGVLSSAGQQESYWLLMPPACIVVGAVTRRWWTVLLPGWLGPAGALLWVLDPNSGDGDAVDSAGSAALFFLVFGAIPLAVLTAVSVAVAKLVVYAQRRRPVPTSA
jgi:hypothetical protein